MISSVSSSLNSLYNYGKEMNGVANRVSKGFQEDSDVDIAKEFAESMVIENGYKANLKVIKTRDELTKSVIDMIG
ncbi:MAG: hypothetical protein HQK76_06500 [Desulfobacterales bacterium]|nr:hypothetical protein [Desulfobacterales bacterium]